jgi:ribonuclease-3
VPQRFDYSFRDPSLLDLALTHASTHASEDNERLEFLGDAALNLIVTDELYARSERLTEGAMTELKAAIVSRATLAKAGRALGLDQLARLGGGMRGRALPGSVLANLYEALLGAIYVDGGYAAARAFALRTLRSSIEGAAHGLAGSNPKQALQHLVQARWAVLPAYELVDSRGSAHARAFLVRAKIGETAFPSAWGRTRKEAERWAAHEALLVLAEAPGGATSSNADHGEEP